jgi:hypothetical protein
MRGRLTGYLAGALLVPGLMAGPLAMAAEVQPASDEQCVMRCDEESDKCMAKSGGDEDKAKACDDRYSECLEKCR